MVVEQGPATSGEKEIKTDWPIEEGIELGTKKQKEETPVLEPEEEDLAVEGKWGSI